MGVDEGLDVVPIMCYEPLPVQAIVENILDWASDQLLLGLRSGDQFLQDDRASWD
jgi:hypothetical protein